MSPAPYASQSDPVAIPPPRPPLYARCDCAEPGLGRTVSGVALCRRGHALAVVDARAAARVLRPLPDGQRYLNRHERRARAARERRS